MRFSSYLKTKSLAEKLCVMGLFLLPYDALPVMPTHYRPISVYFFALSLFLYILGDCNAKLVVDKNMRRLFGFCLYSIPVGIITSIFFHNPFGNVIDHYAAFVMGLLAYVCVSLYLYRSTTSNTIIDTVTDILALAYTIPVIICVIEVFAIYTPFPISIKIALNNLFGGWQSGRICGSSSETSWMALHLLSIMPIYYYRGFYKNEYARKALFFMTVLSFCFCFSLKGYILLAIAGIVYYILQSANKKQLAVAICKLVILVVIFRLAWLLIAYVASQMEGSYFTARILNFSTSLSWRDMLFLDGSVFIRTGFPLIALQIFFDHPLFGTGAGSFAYMMKDYLLKNFPEALNYNEVWYYISTGTSANTTIYAKLFSEFGLFGAFLYLRFYISAATEKISSITTPVFVFWASILLAMPFQQGSYAYLPMWVGLATMNALPEFGANKIIRRR